MYRSPKGGKEAWFQGLSRSGAVERTTFMVTFAD
jgi:hypothetical protein